MEEVFDEEFHIEKMRKQILLREEKLEKKYMYNFSQYTIPICLMILICSGVALKYYHSTLKQEESHIEIEEKEEYNIYINPVDGIDLMRIDADIREISMNGFNIPWPDILKGGIVIPKDLDNFHAYSIYTRESKTGDYDHLNCYVYHYFSTKTKADKDIRMALSNTEKPIRDYFFDNIGEVSTIHGIEFTLFQYENTYFTEFYYKNYYFDIETTGVNIEELTALLESIIQ